MNGVYRWLAGATVLVSIVLGAPSAGAAGNPMTLVGALNPWKNGQFSNVAADASRHVGYLGSFDDQGVAVIETTDPTHPVLTDRLSTHITSDTQTSDSADLDLVGRYLAVSHQPWTDRGFSGISIYDTAANPSIRRCSGASHSPAASTPCNSIQRWSPGGRTRTRALSSSG